MNHDIIAADNTIERYLSDALTSSESTAFEQHYLFCQQCLDELADTLALRDGMQEMVRIGELALPATGKPRWRNQSWAIAASVLLAVSLTATGVLNHDRLSPAAAPATAQVFSLVAVRGASDDEPVNQVRPATSTGALVLLVDAGSAEREQSYTVTIDSDSGNLRRPVPVSGTMASSKGTPITLEQLIPGNDSRLALSLPSDALAAGDYRIDVRRQGEEAVLTSVRFRLVK